MKILVALLASLSVAPAAEALTWKEFWEPFVEYGNHYHQEVHYYDHHHRPRYYPPYRGCWEEKLVKEKIWIPGYWIHGGEDYIRGHYNVRTKITKVPTHCRHPH